MAEATQSASSQKIEFITYLKIRGVKLVSEPAKSIGRPKAKPIDASITKELDVCRAWSPRWRPKNVNPVEGLEGVSKPGRSLA